MLTLQSQAERLAFFLSLCFLIAARGQINPLHSAPSTTTAADSVITFNEIMYHPAKEDSGMEWLELYNQMSVNMDISNWRVGGGVEFEFPSNTVFAANSYIVVAADPERLRGRTRLTNIFGPFTGRLSGGGETLRLRNQSGRLMDELSYMDQDPWPVGADGSGASLSKRDRFNASSPAANWRASAQPGGTPGQVNFPQTAGAVPPISQLIAPAAVSRWLVPKDDSLGQSWTLPTFDDAAWPAGNASVGYDTGTVGPIELTNVALNKMVIDGSGAYSNNPFDVPDGAGNFIAQNVTDGSTADEFGVNYWLGRQGRINEYFTLDLGASAQIQEIHLRNTHNTTYNDRGTAKFQILASESIDASRHLVQPTLILSGVLTRVTGLSPIPANVFTGANGLLVTNARYLKFVALTADNSGNNVGLNEIEVYSPAQQGAYNRFFGTDVQSSLYTKNSSLFLRIPFENSSQVSYDQLTLRLRYADGFVAFLNGVEVLRRNAPQVLSWDSTATLDRADTDAVNIETFDLSPHLSRVGAGKNVLAIQALNSSAADPAFLFSAELSARVVQSGAVTNMAFSETAAAGSSSFFVELLNYGTTPGSLSGSSIFSSGGASFQLGANALAGGAFLALTTKDVGFSVQAGDRLFLLGPEGGLIDAVEVHNRARARLIPGPEALWFYPSRETPGQANEFSFHREIVINEIMYHHPPVYRTTNAPFTENEEQWIELYNASSNPVDLGAWRLDGAVSYAFPSGTVLAADSYLVIADNAAVLRAKYPGITVLGNFQGRLSHHAARVILRDPSSNVADEIYYQNSHPWPEYANGGGSSLELRDPRSDNSVPESWGASIEGTKAPWRRYTYRAVAVRPVYAPAIFNFHEFRMGLLDAGEALIDNISVTEITSSPRQLLQNTDFSLGATRWRLLGNHSHSYVEPNPDEPSNSVLHLVATGSTSYLDNRLETTLKSGTTLVPVVTGGEYEISFDAKWLAGSPQMRTELYYNKIAETTILEMPSNCGTPGRRNSVYTPNSGPAYFGLSHSPVIPKSTESINVAISAVDPDGIASLALFYSVNGAAWRNIPMTRSALDSAAFTAVLPPQANGAVIQFCIEGTDSLGAVSTYPAGGKASRALIKVDSPRFVSGKQTFRTIMTPADSSLLHAATNMMSDDLLGCTVVHDEREVFYDAQIRLHGSMFSRDQPNLTGFAVKFPADHPFRGSRESVIVRRRGLVENVVKHILNSAGGLPGNYDDVVHLVSHRSDNTGTARLNLANYDDTYIDSQFENDNDGTVFKLEGIREYQTTQNGSPEGYKLSQPIGWIQSFDITNLGNDPEQYRWGIMIQNDRQRDDYSRIVAMGKAFSLSGTALKQAASEAVDIDEWARLFALQSLLGIADVYGVENPHNFAFYVRPSDGRAVGLQNDWEFAFGASATASIYGSKNVYKVLRLPGFQRVYQGHLLDLINSVVNSSYLTPWARHYSTVMGENYNGFPSYVTTRGNSVRKQLAAQIPFEIQSNNGVDFAVDTAVVTLEGRGWIDVYRIYRTGQSNALPVLWLDNERWQTTFPLTLGTNRIELQAYNFRGVQVGQDSISIATTVSGFPQRDYLRITELMYHPLPPSTAEAKAGFIDGDDFEFVELLNAGPVALSLKGVRFTAGITFDFTAGSITNLLPLERVLVVKNGAAFAFRYGTNLPIAGEYSGSLANGGELLRLVDSFGGIIHEFVFGDQDPWPNSPDGNGHSLEVLNLSGDYNDPANWQSSPLIDGSPGAPTGNRPAFTAVTFNNSQLHLFFQAAPRQPYAIYASDTLTAGSWTLLKEVPAALESRVEEVLVTAFGPERFYRISAP